MQTSKKLSDLLSRLDRVKQAADAYNSAMPDDTAGDGTQDIQTGSAFSEYDKDFNNIKSPGALAANGEPQSADADGQTEHPLSDIDLSVAGDASRSSNGEYEEYAPDPGTSMPAEAGQEKLSSARTCTLEENIAYFEKCAGAYYQTVNAYQTSVNHQIKQAAAAVQLIDSFAPGELTKRAAEEGATPEEQEEIAAVEALLQENPEVLEEILEAAPEEQAAVADAAEQITPEDIDGVEEDTESEPVSEAPVSEEDAELEKQCFYQQPYETRRLLKSASVRDLKDLAALADYLYKKAEDGELTPEEAEAIISDDTSAEGAPEEAMPSEDDIDLSSLSEEELAALEQLIQEEEAGSPEGDVLEECADGDCKTASLAQLSSNDLLKVAAYKRQLEEEEAAFNSLPYSWRKKLAEASDEELAEVIQAGSEDPEAADENANILEAMSGDSAGSEEEVAPEEAADEGLADEEVAVDELSSALADAGVTPEMLAEIAQEKQSSYNQSDREDAVFLYDNAVKVADWRNSGNWRYGAPTTQKRAELRRGFARYLQEVCSR